MPDTGAPWNIPYVAGTDLVSDWPTDSLALANAVASGLDAAGNAGIGSNVVSVTKTDLFSTASSTYVDITGLTVTITPSAASSKIFVILTVIGAGTNTLTNGCLQLVRDSTPIAIGGSGTAVTAQLSAGPATDNAWGVSASHLDSPSTTSPVTYKVQARRLSASGTVYINSAAVAATQAVSSITAIEVRA